MKSTGTENGGYLVAHRPCPALTRQEHPSVEGLGVRRSLEGAVSGLAPLAVALDAEPDLGWVDRLVLGDAQVGLGVVLAVVIADHDDRLDTSRLRLQPHLFLVLTAHHVVPNVRREVRADEVADDQSGVGGTVEVVVAGLVQVEGAVGRPLVAVRPVVVGRDVQVGDVPITHAPHVRPAVVQRVGPLPGVGVSGVGRVAAVRDSRLLGVAAVRTPVVLRALSNTSDQGQ